jgi:hypothetical protein
VVDEDGKLWDFIKGPTGYNTFHQGATPQAIAMEGIITPSPLSHLTTLPLPPQISDNIAEPTQPLIPSLPSPSQIIQEVEINNQPGINKIFVTQLH